MLTTTQNKKLIHERFNKNFATYNRSAIVQRQIAARLGCLIQQFLPKNQNRVLEIGCGTGFMTQELVSKFGINEFFVNDLIASCEGYLKTIKDSANIKFIKGDAENMSLPNNLDSIISTSSFQWFQDIDSFFKKLVFMLNSEGLIAFSTFGERNFREIKDLLGVSLKYKSKSELIDLLAKNYNLLHEEEWMQVEKFQNPMEVLRHIKKTGVNAISDRILTKGQLSEFQKDYKRKYEIKGHGVSLTYHPIIIIAKRKKKR